MNSMPPWRPRCRYQLQLSALLLFAASSAPHTSVAQTASHSSGMATANGAGATPTSAVPPRKLVDAGAWICAVDPQEEVQCWLRVEPSLWPSPTLKASPASFQKLPGLTQVVAIDGDSDYVCALDRRGDVYCWGAIWTHDLQRLWPKHIALASQAKQLVVSAGEGCALLDNAEVQCWGAAICMPGVTSPRGVITLSEEPETVSLPVRPIQLSARLAAWCALDQGGGVTCWGDICHGHTDPMCMPPTRMPVRNVSAIASMCGIAGTEREVHCWGGRDGWQTPESAADQRNYCRDSTLRDLKHVKQLSLGFSSGLVLTDEGAVYYWGDSHTGGILHLGSVAQAAERVSLEHARQQGDFGASFEAPVPEVSVDSRKPARSAKRFSLAPRRIADVRGVQGLVSSGHYNCLIFADGVPHCEFVLGRTPFHLEEVWPTVQFDSGGPLMQP